MLRDENADPNIADREGQTPLMWCAQNNHPALVRQLGNTGRCQPGARRGRTKLLCALVLPPRLWCLPPIVIDASHRSGRSVSRTPNCVVMVSAELADLTNRTALDHAVFEKNSNCAALLSDAAFIGAHVAERHGAFVGKARALASGPSLGARRATAFAGAKVASKILPRVRAKIQAAAYVSGGQDWEKLFRFYDKSGDGELQLEELTSAIRRDLKLAPKDVSNDEIKIVLDSLDADGGGSVDIDELVGRRFFVFFVSPRVYARLPACPSQWGKKPPRVAVGGRCRIKPRALTHSLSHSLSFLLLRFFAQLHFIDPGGHPDPAERGAAAAPPPALGWTDVVPTVAAASKWRAAGAAAHERAIIADFDVAATIHDMTWKRGAKGGGKMPPLSPIKRPGSAGGASASMAAGSRPSTAPAAFGSTAPAALGVSQSAPMLAAAAALAKTTPEGAFAAVANDEEMSVGTLGSMFGR